MLTAASKFLSLNVLDLVKGTITAVFGAVAGIILPTLQSGSFEISWPLVLKASLISAFSYLAKNLLTNSEGQFLQKEAK